MKTGRISQKSGSRNYFQENLELKAEIDRTRNKMNTVRSQFEEAVDPTLIDCCIYELKAIQLRYQFLLRRFKVLEELCASKQP